LRSESAAPAFLKESGLAGVGILLIAVSIRNAVGALSPLFDQIDADIAVNSVAIGLLGTLPTLCFGVFGLVALRLRAAAPLELMIVGSLGALVVGQVLRAVAGDIVSLLAASALAFAGMGVANVTLPPAVKRYFPASIGLMTSLFATGMAVFAFIPPLVAVPLAELAGWRISVGSWALLAAIAAVPWLVLWARRKRLPSAELARQSDRSSLAAGSRALGRMVWRSHTAWALALLFAATSVNIFGMFAWLPELLIAQAEVDPAAAGALLGLYGAFGAVASLTVPPIAARHPGFVMPLVIVGALGPALGYCGMLIAPVPGVLLWLTLIGFGWVTFPLVLFLVNARSHTTSGSIVLSGFTQGVGYLLSAGVPVLVGVLLAATGAWTAPILLFVAMAPIALVTGIIVARSGPFESAADGLLPSQHEAG